MLKQILFNQKTRLITQTGRYILKYNNTFLPRSSAREKMMMYINCFHYYVKVEFILISQKFIPLIISKDQGKASITAAHNYYFGIGRLR